MAINNKRLFGWGTVLLTCYPVSLGMGTLMVFLVTALPFYVPYSLEMLVLESLLYMPYASALGLVLIIVYYFRTLGDSVR